MTFVELTSLIGAIGATIAAIAAVLGYRQQRKTDMRRTPMFEISFDGPMPRIPDISTFEVVVRNTEAAGYTLERIQTNKPVLVQNRVVPETFDTVGNPVGWSGINNVALKKELPAEIDWNSGDEDHYLFSCRSSSSSNREMRVKIWLIWHWNDESRQRRTKRTLTIKPSITS